MTATYNADKNNVRGGLGIHTPCQNVLLHHSKIHGLSYVCATLSVDGCHNLLWFSRVVFLSLIAVDTINDSQINSREQWC